jgi:hypothetical protein
VALRQGPQQTIQEYMTKFDAMRAEYEAAGGLIDITMEMTLFVAGLRQEFNKEAYIELSRQKQKPDIEALRQALIRHASFEKRRDMRQLTPVTTDMTISTTHAPHTKLAGKPISEQLLHRRMSHLNQEYVRLLPPAAKQESFYVRRDDKDGTILRVEQSPHWDF